MWANYIRWRVISPNVRVYHCKGCIRNVGSLAALTRDYSTGELMIYCDPSNVVEGVERKAGARARSLVRDAFVLACRREHKGNAELRIAQKAPAELVVKMCVLIISCSRARRQGDSTAGHHHHIHHRELRLGLHQSHPWAAAATRNSTSSGATRRSSTASPGGAA